MSVADNSRTPAELVALAAGLARLPSGARAATFDDLLDGVERLGGLAEGVFAARGDLEYATVSGRGVEAARAVVQAKKAAFDEGLRVLVKRATADLPADAAPRQRLAVISAVPDGSNREAWINAARAGLREAADALRAEQVASDQKLFNTNEDVRKACAELSSMSRISLVEQALTAGDASLLSQLSAKMPLAGFAVADVPTPVALSKDGRPRRSLELDADELTSDLTAAPAAALARLSGRPARAVVLFSDGRQVGGDPSVVSGLSATGVPVFTIAAAARAPVRDLALRDVAFPRSVFLGESATIRLSVDHNGITAAAGTVRLNIDATTQPSTQPSTKPATQSASTRATQPTGQTQPFEFKVGVPAAAQFSFKPDRAGAVPVTLSVDPVGGEATLENNQVRRWMKVLPSKLRVAAFAGSSGWDFQYLRNALARSSWVGLDAGVLNPVKPKLPLSPQQILDLDVIVLSDVSVESLDDAQWDAVHRLVTERGGSAILIAGRTHLPAGYAGHVIAADLLPFNPEQRPTWRVWPGEQPSFGFVPAPGAQDSDLLRLGDDARVGGTGASSRRWEELPGVYHFLPLSTWDPRARRFPELKPNTGALLVEAESRAAVLTESRLGAGRVLFLGLDETWRWRFKTGERDQDRFWLQLVRYAAEEPYAVRDGPFALDADRISAAPGEPVNVRARIPPATTTAGGTAPVLEIVSGGGMVRIQNLAPTAAPGAGRYGATVRDLAPGQYTLRLRMPDSAHSPLEVLLYVEVNAEAEMADVSGDDALLRRLADASGGEFLTLDQIKRLPSLLTATTESRSRFVEQPLWDSPYLFVFVVGCFGVEWALRKRSGLA
jgi:hypothetical protein